MPKLFTQQHKYENPWSTVALAFFLRYPNPYASHVLSCDVLSRSHTPQGTLLTTRLILKRGTVPKWVPAGLVPRAESWIIEESEVDPVGRVVRCTTRNLDHVKVMSVREQVTLREGPNNSTLQTTEARVVSNFGWGLAKRIERYGHEKFQRNIEKSRAGIALVVTLLQQARLQTAQTLAYNGGLSGTGTVMDSFRPRLYVPAPPPAASEPEFSFANASAHANDAGARSQADGSNEETPEIGAQAGRSWKNPFTWLRRG